MTFFIRARFVPSSSMFELVLGDGAVHVDRDQFTRFVAAFRHTRSDASSQKVVVEARDSWGGLELTLPRDQCARILEYLELVEEGARAHLEDNEPTA